MEKKEKYNRKNKKKWTKPYLRNLKINNTLGGAVIGDAEGVTYDGTLS